MTPDAQPPAGTEPLAGPPGSEPAAAPEPPSSPATPTGVTPGEGAALTGDGAPREEQGDENAEGGGFPDEERLAEMLEQSKATSADPDEYEVEEPTAMGSAHVVQDNVTDPEHHEARLAGGVTEQDNVSSDGEQITRQADRGESVHSEPNVAAEGADTALDGTLQTGKLDPDA